MAFSIRNPTILSKVEVLRHNKEQKMPARVIKHVTNALLEAAEEVAERLVEEDETLSDTYRNLRVAAFTLSQSEDFDLEMDYIFTNDKGEHLTLIDIDEFDGFDDLGDIVGCDDLDDIPEEFDWVYLDEEVYTAYAEMYHKIGEKRQRSD